MLNTFVALTTAPKMMPRPTMQARRLVWPWLKKLYHRLNDNYALGQYLDVENHRWDDDLQWVQIPLRGMRPARQNEQDGGTHCILFYGVNSWKWIVPIVRAGFLKPSELAERNAGDKSCPKLFGGLTVGLAEKYACPHMFDGKWLQVMFVASHLQAVKHPKNYKRGKVFCSKDPETVELVGLRLRISPCPPQKYHLHVRSPFDPPDWIT